MRKFLVLLLLGGALLVAGPAAGAHPGDPARDPFLPLVTPTTAPAAPGDPLDPAATLPPLAPAPTDPLPDTGGSPVPWVGMGYLLVAFGAGAVALSRLFGPVLVSGR